jgi:hypothetical protein
MAAVCATPRFRSSGERLLFGAFPPLDAAVMNDKVCPIPAARNTRRDRLSWVVSRLRTRFLRELSDWSAKHRQGGAKILQTAWEHCLRRWRYQSTAPEEVFGAEQFRLWKTSPMR